MSEKAKVPDLNEENVCELSNKRLFLWLRQHFSGYASLGSGEQAKYDAVRTEITRRLNISILWLTRAMVALTLVLVVIGGASLCLLACK